MDEIPFQEEMVREREMEHRAQVVLGVRDGASADEIRRAWRRGCLRTHPDRNPRNPHAQRDFRMVNCAHHYLTDGVPCDELLDVPVGHKADSEDGKYDLDNTWGFFLWWRDKFF